MQLNYGGKFEVYNKIKTKEEDRGKLQRFTKET